MNLQDYISTDKINETFYKIIIHYVDFFACIFASLILNNVQVNEFEKLCDSDDLEFSITGENIINNDKYAQFNIDTDWNLLEYSTLLVDLGKQQVSLDGKSINDVRFFLKIIIFSLVQTQHVTLYSAFHGWNPSAPLKGLTNLKIESDI